MIYFALLFFSLSLSAYAAEPPSQELPGLTVREGQLWRQGKPYRGVGANYFSLFSRTLKDPSDTSYDAGLKQLSEAKIPFVRFMACGFWPVDWDLYLRDKESYFKLLDRVVHSAEQHQVGLIPSLFWHVPVVSDIVGEPLDQLGNQDSRTSAFIRQYTSEVVQRYRDSPAIWGWEFGNEYNLAVDLPNASEHRPQVVPHLKTALERTSRDELSSQAMLVAFSQFASAVRMHDSHRILITGNSLPRPSAYHNSIEKSWQADSKAQFEEVLLRDNPDPFEIISVHVYGNTGQAGTASLEELSGTLDEISLQAKKPVFVGEFGVPNTLTADQERAQFRELLDAFETNKVPLAAFWVFDLPSQAEWNVTTENARSYMLEQAGAANERIAIDETER